MIDHEKVIQAMNTRQTLLNLKSTHPIKDALNVIIKNKDSCFHKKMLEELDGPGENYCESLNTINSKVLDKDPAYLQQDRLAKDMLLKERLTLITRPDRRHSIEMAILRNQGKITVRQLLADPVMANHFRMRILHYRYSTLMDACIKSLDQDPVADQFIPVRGKYKMGDRVTSKDLRTELELPNENMLYKFPIPKENIELMLPKINKLKCVKMKSFALRLINGDIYTGTRLYKFGLKANDECDKCRQSENLEHLLAGCWYSGRIWSRLKQLYRLTDHRRQEYNNHSLSFVIGSRLSKAKIKLHLEIIRRLCNKDRPNILPTMLITQSLDYLITCDSDHFRYYKRLKAKLITL